MAKSEVDENRTHGGMAVPAGLKTAAGWAWRIIVVAVVVLAFGRFALYFSTILISLMVSVLIAVILEPASSFLRNRWHWPPALAALVTLFVLVVVVGALLAGAGTGIVSGLTDLADQAKAGVTNLIELVSERLPNFQGTLDNAWQQAQESLQANSSTIVGGVAAVGSSVSGFFAGLILTLFSLFFFLKDGRQLWQWVVRLVPSSYQTKMNEAGIRAWVTIGNYTRTQALVAAIDAVGIGAIAMLLKTPLSLAFPVALMVFMFSFIPIVGAFVSGFLAVLIVFVNTQSIGAALLMALGVLIVQQAEGNVLSPILQGNALNMHALAILLTVAAGSALAGIVGALFSVPIVAALNTTILYLRGHDTYPYLSKIDDRPGGAPKDFSEYNAEHWKKFDDEVVQHLSPKERRAKRREKRRNKRKK